MCCKWLPPNPRKHSPLGTRRPIVGLDRRCRQVRVEAQVSEDEILAPVAVDVDGGNGIPPPFGSAEPRCLRTVDEVAVLLSKDTHGTVVRFAPPLTIDRETLDWAVEEVRAVFMELGGGLRRAA